MLKVFVVDDQISVRIGFRHLDWSQYGCALVGDAGNGIEALDRIATLKPDVVISDIRMPQMDGLELSGMIKRMYPGCSIVLLTGYDEFAYAQQALNIGVDHLLLKPTNFDELAKTLALLSEKHALGQEESISSQLHVSNLVQENLLRDMIYGKAVHQEMLKMMRLEAHQQRRFALMSIIPDAPSSGESLFLPTAKISGAYARLSQRKTKCKVCPPSPKRYAFVCSSGNRTWRSSSCWRLARTSPRGSKSTTPARH